MIPTDIADRMSMQPDDVARGDAEEAKRQLRALGFRADSEVVEFFRRYSVAGVLSASSDEELLDPAYPSPQLEAVNGFVRETYEVPTQFVWRVQDCQEGLRRGGAR